MFSKSYESVSAFELHELIEELVKFIYLNRKNLTLEFLTTVNFALTHPHTDVVDYNVSLIEPD